jgi:nucleotide-binding universal stress UspA family protein
MVRTEEMLRMGFMGDELMHISEEIKASYIVMAVQHTSGLKRFFSGSSTMHILKKSKIPVITVPENLVFKAIKKIAYATDLTFNDNDILGRLLQVAELLGAEVKCFHVHDSDLEVENSIIQDFIVQYSAEIKQGLISFQLVDNVNVLDGIDFFVNEHEIDLLAVLKQKSYWLELEESMTKLLAFHTNIPLLVYHE